MEGMAKVEVADEVSGGVLFVAGVLLAFCSLMEVSFLEQR